MKGSVRKISMVLAGILIIAPALSFASPSPEDLQAQITALLARIRQMQSQLEELRRAPQGFCYTWTKNLRIGDRGVDVHNLQNALTKEGFSIAAGEAPQAPGGVPETQANAYFGESTAAALVGFQEKYRNEILTPSGLRNGTGYAGPSTRAKLNQLYGCKTGEPRPGEQHLNLSFGPYKTVYAPGESIALTLKATKSIGDITTPGTPAEGFRVSLMLLGSVGNQLKSLNADYNAGTGYWEAQLTAPTDTSMVYTVNANFWCADTEASCGTRPVYKGNGTSNSFKFELAGAKTMATIDFKPAGYVDRLYGSMVSEDAVVPAFAVNVYADKPAYISSLHFQTDDATASFLSNLQLNDGLTLAPTNVVAESSGPTFTEHSGGRYANYNFLFKGGDRLISPDNSRTFVIYAKTAPGSAGRTFRFSLTGVGHSQPYSVTGLGNWGDSKQIGATTLQPSVFYVQSKAGKINTIYPGEKASIFGSGLKTASANGYVMVQLTSSRDQVTRQIDGQTNAAGTEVTFLPPTTLPAGSYTLSVAARTLYETAPLSVTVLAATQSSIRVISPNGNQVWTRGESRNITWSGSPRFDNEIQLINRESNTYGPSGYVLKQRATQTGTINSFTWIVGNMDNYYRCLDLSCPITSSPAPIPDGTYKVRIIAPDGSADESDVPFTLASNSQPPVISGVSGPTQLTQGAGSGGATGTWTVTARDPQNGALTYSVIWGDETRLPSATAGTSMPYDPPRQTATFTHTYASAGTYTPTFTVTNSRGQSETTRLTVNVIPPVTANRPVASLVVNGYSSTGYAEPTISLGRVQTVTIRWSSTNAAYCNTYGQSTLQLTDGTTWNSSNLPTSGTRTFNVAGQKDAQGNALSSASIGIQCWNNGGVSDSKGLLATWTNQHSSPTVLIPNWGDTIYLQNDLTVTFRPVPGARHSINLVDESRSHSYNINPLNAPDIVGISGDRQSVLIRGGMFNHYNIPSSNRFRIKICASDSNTVIGCDESDNYFSVVNGAVASTIRVLAPNGGERMLKENGFTARWTTSNNDQLKWNPVLLYLVPQGSTPRTGYNHLSAVGSWGYSLGGVSPDRNNPISNTTQSLTFTADHLRDIPEGTYKVRAYLFPARDSFATTGPTASDLTSGILAMDESDTAFTIASNSQPPVISGVSGPSQLAVNQSSTWSVSARDPQGGSLLLRGLG